MDTATRAIALAYFCPVCGIDLEGFDSDKAPEDYYCPSCCSQQRPSQVTGRVGWDFPY